ncbi:MAG: DUF3365 domain-containing protein [Planctomycetota bacterium]
MNPAAEPDRRVRPTSRADAINARPARRVHANDHADDQAATATPIAGAASYCPVLFLPPHGSGRPRTARIGLTCTRIIRGRGRPIAAFQINSWSTPERQSLRRERRESISENLGRPRTDQVLGKRARWYLEREDRHARHVWADLAPDERPHEAIYFADNAGRLGAITPIRLAASCLQCHGGPRDIAPPTRGALARRYPADRATGFTEGDLRGWFWVEVPATEP